MARSIFNGQLTLDDLTIPVKLHSAVDPPRVRFRLLHESDGVPIRQRLIHPKTGEEIPRERARRGYALPGGLVEIHDEELAALEPQPSRDLELLRFVPVAALGHSWYVRPYILGPAGPTDEYFAFARALAAEDKLGIVRWTMRKIVYHGALRAVGDALVLLVLRSPAELVAVEALPDRAWPALSDQELDMAQTLIAMLEGEPEFDQFHDRYAEQVEALAAAKASGRALPPPAPARAPTRPPSLGDALAASIAALERGRQEERGVA